MTFYVKKCQKARPTDKYLCFFYIKVIFTLFLIFNIVSILTFLLGKDWVFRQFFAGGDSNPAISIITPVCLYLLISLLFPEKKLFVAEMDERQEKEASIYLIIYVALTLVLMATATLIGR